MKLSLGISSCPNDTFIFDALIHGKVDTGGHTFDVLMTDVEELNRKAFDHSIQITKLSFHAFAYVAGNYSLLNAGSALGRKNGPLVIGREYTPSDQLDLLRIAIPGKFTTANLLFSLFFPHALNKHSFLFSDIEEAILNHTVDAGVIIHENRFTFEKKGLVKLTDLGELWETKTGFPVPLGGIAVDNSLPVSVQHELDRILKDSVRFAMNFPESSADFVRKNAIEMEEQVIRQHINLYVNNFTEDMGEEGKKAIRLFFQSAEESRIIPALPHNYFLQA
jgi:1,4-dihydroxy-6-naphthoate synthase